MATPALRTFCAINKGRPIPTQKPSSDHVQETSLGMTATQISLSNQQLEQLSAFEAMVRKESKQQNLVSAGDLPNLRERHTEDSLQLLKIPYPSASERWLDMGCGAGFPLLPLAIALPAIRFTGVEPRGQRARFLTRVVRELGLEDRVQILASQVEAVANWPSLAGSMDVVSCRALGSFAEDHARALPFLKPGGIFATLKTDPPPPSIDGVGPLSYVPYRLAGDPTTRHVVFAPKPSDGLES